MRQGSIKFMDGRMALPNDENIFARQVRKLPPDDYYDNWGLNGNQIVYVKNLAFKQDLHYLYKFQQVTYRTISNVLNDIYLYQKISLSIKRPRNENIDIFKNEQEIEEKRI